MAKSRLFSSANRIASFSDKYSLPSRMSWLSKGEFVSCGSGTSLGEYALKGLCDFVISKDTDAFVCADAVAVMPIRSQARILLNHPARARFLIASPPRTAEARDSLCRQPANHLAAELCESRKPHWP